MVCTYAEQSHILPSQLQRGPVIEKYPHIVNVEAPVTARNHEEDRSGNNSNGFKNFDMEGSVENRLLILGFLILIPNHHNTTFYAEEMIRELTKLSWERVDVSFRGTLQRFMAHNTIQASVHHLHIIIIIVIVINLHSQIWKT